MYLMFGRDLYMPKKVFFFTIAAYSITWAVWLPLALNAVWDLRIPVLPGQFFIGSLGPLLAAGAGTLLQGRAAFTAWVKRTFSLRASRRVWLFVACSLPLYAALGTLAYRLGGNWPDMAAFGLTEKLPGFSLPATAAVWILTYGLGEETGWRAYLLPLLRQKYPLPKSTVLVWLIWMFWHLPAFFFNPAYQAMGLGVVGWAVSLLFGSALLGFLAQEGNYSILPVMLWHAGFDLITASDQATPLVGAAVCVAVILQALYVMRRYGGSAGNLRPQ